MNKKNEIENTPISNSSNGGNESFDRDAGIAMPDEVRIIRKHDLTEHSDSANLLPPPQDKGDLSEAQMDRDENESFEFDGFELFPGGSPIDPSDVCLRPAVEIDVSVGVESDRSDFKSSSGFEEEQEFAESNACEDERLTRITAQYELTPGRRRRLRTQLSDVDVVCGRGELANQHEGNVLFREERERLNGEYRARSRDRRVSIAIQMARSVHERGGSFLRKNDQGTWDEIPDREAVRKCQHALREKKKLAGKRKRTQQSKNNSDDKKPPPHEGGDDKKPPPASSGDMSSPSIFSV